jgi:peptide/nickel transport system permease protein
MSAMLAAIAFASIASWRLLGIEGLALDLAGSVLVLALGVVILTFGEVLLITRATMEDAIEADYVMAARAKGLPPRTIRDRHAGRAALLPTLSRFVVAIPYFLTGLIILESVFHVNGMGTLLFEALRLQDTPLLASSLVVVGAITIVLRIALDLAHVALDPRLRSTIESTHAR